MLVFSDILSVNLILIGILILSLLIWFIKISIKKTWYFPILSYLDDLKPAYKSVLKFHRPPLISFLCFLALGMLVLFLSFKPGFVGDDSFKLSKSHELWILDLSASLSHLSIDSYKNFLYEHIKTINKNKKDIELSVIKSNSLKIEHIAKIDDFVNYIKNHEISYHKSGFRLKSLLDYLAATNQLLSFSKIKIFTDNDNYSLANISSEYLASLVRSNNLNTVKLDELYFEFVTVTDELNDVDQLVDYQIIDAHKSHPQQKKTTTTTNNNLMDDLTSDFFLTVSIANHIIDLKKSFNVSNNENINNNNSAKNAQELMLNVYLLDEQIIKKLFKGRLTKKDLNDAWSLITKSNIKLDKNNHTKNYSVNNYKIFVKMPDSDSKYNLQKDQNNQKHHDNYTKKKYDDIKILKLVLESTKDNKTLNDRIKLNNEFIFVPKRKDAILVIGSSLGESSLQDPLSPVMWSLKALDFKVTRIDNFSEVFYDNDHAYKSLFDLDDYKLIFSFVGDSSFEGDHSECIDHKKNLFLNSQAVVIAPNDNMANIHWVCNCVDVYDGADNIDCDGLLEQFDSSDEDQRQSKKDIFQKIVQSYGYKKHKIEPVIGDDNNDYEYNYFYYRDFNDAYYKNSKVFNHVSSIIVFDYPLNPYLSYRNKNIKLNLNQNQGYEVKSSIAKINHGNITNVIKKIIDFSMHNVSSKKNLQFIIHNNPTLKTDDNDKKLEVYGKLFDKLLIKSSSFIDDYSKNKAAKSIEDYIYNNSITDISKLLELLKITDFSDFQSQAKNRINLDNINALQLMFEKLLNTNQSEVSQKYKIYPHQLNKINLNEINDKIKSIDVFDKNQNKKYDDIYKITVFILLFFMTLELLSEFYGFFKKTK